MSVSYPTADDVAIALVTAAKETGECPLYCAKGGYGLHCRHYAAHALMRVYPDMLTSTLARVVGAQRSYNSFFTQSRTRVARGQVPWWDNLVVNRVEAAIRGCRSKQPFRLVDNCASRHPLQSASPLVTATLMGDPPAGRSALDQKNGHKSSNTAGSKP